ncbi:HPF/RaiA family ribosome-associated protein [Anaeromyxobacter sp. PSR-1]|uniref:HPF/RaiA family ribosome-associated protein n=1 Tax=unclassified Anaeromyxobacter TaxID=2620896 RepID=UPI0005DAEE71|nr:HPF/RaiA family ribosome-associated protein [Anaeromyxobacter sp. PSR-1]GAO02414.1 cold shock protein 2 [Anaeromyxobacter sp. PSR-1]
METPLQLAWIHVEPSEPLAERVREAVRRLERFHGRITGCTVALEAPSRHHRNAGAQYRVRIELRFPGGRAVVGRAPPKSRDRADLYAALNAAFRDVRRQLEDRQRRMDGRVKAHEAPPHGVVARIFHGEGFGFLRTPDDREIYFDARSVLRGGFERLEIGSPVRFVEEPGDEGPQASTVAPLRRRAAAPAAPAQR